MNTFGADRRLKTIDFAVQCAQFRIKLEMVRYCFSERSNEPDRAADTIVALLLDDQKNKYKLRGNGSGGSRKKRK